MECYAGQRQYGRIVIGIRMEFAVVAYASPDDIYDGLPASGSRGSRFIVSECGLVSGIFWVIQGCSCSQTLKHEITIYKNGMICQYLHLC